MRLPPTLPRAGETIDSITDNTYDTQVPRRRNVLVILLLVVPSIIGAACAEEGTNVTESSPATTGTPAPAVLAADIPVAKTPPGGWTTMPAPILTACTEPLVEGAPDLRGMWKTVSVEVEGQPAPDDHPAYGVVQRVEQCGDRIVITAGGIIHDMRADGTEENGVNDVAERDFTTPITVVATYEDGVHVLRPVGIPVEVTRELDGDQMIWTYLNFTARLERIGPPEADPPAA